MNVVEFYLRVIALIISSVVVLVFTYYGCKSCVEKYRWKRQQQQYGVVTIVVIDTVPSA